MMKVKFNAALAVMTGLALLQAGNAWADDGMGVLHTSIGAYEFAPRVCAVFKEDDFHDIEINGQGQAPDGEVFFFELSSTGNHIELKLGVDSPFASSKRILQAGRYLSAEFEIEVAGDAPNYRIAVSSLNLVDGDRQMIDEAASLSIEC